ncbi:hypothetical protein [Aquibacillus salsiterrae]|uniref:Uncharacterized protein n=1 Tax=Aquibacillus salsiterrae TaxID=2950439 RepID=A0A9X3WDQ3_9BACI|nr:hypothetical protein [Aquibacillus salsiterrae]MDC3416838.1 hypothetical protein [Aquibacillus salsiterrae]
MSFTGSTKIGKNINETAAKSFKGNNAPLRA